MATCRKCDGYGYYNCPRCSGGAGSVGNVVSFGFFGTTVDCYRCHGAGNFTVDCRVCGGEGKVDCNLCETNRTVECRACEGSGKYLLRNGQELDCLRCDGSGFRDCPGAKILMTAWLIAMSVKAKRNLNMNAGDVKDMDRLNALGAKGEVY